MDEIRIFRTKVPGLYCRGSGFSVPGMVFSLPEVLFSRIWVFSSRGVSCSRWCYQFPPPWVCGSRNGVFSYLVGVLGCHIGVCSSCGCFWFPGSAGGLDRAAVADRMSLHLYGLLPELYQDDQLGMFFCVGASQNCHQPIWAVRRIHARVSELCWWFAPACFVESRCRMGNLEEVSFQHGQNRPLLATARLRRFKTFPSKILLATFASAGPRPAAAKMWRQWQLAYPNR